MTIEALRIGDVSVEEIDLTTSSTDDIVRLNEFTNVVETEVIPDEPAIPVERTALGLANVPSGTTVRAFCAREPDGTFAAVSRGAYVRPDGRVRSLDVDLNVRPDRRRRGLGRAMLRRVVEVAEAEGLSLLTGSTNERVPAGEAFARRSGAELVQATHTNRLLLADVDRDLVRRWIDDGPRRAPGYSLVFVEGPAPDEFIEQIVDAFAVMRDAPLDDRSTEYRHVNVEDYREMDRLSEIEGYAHLAVYARHDASGRFVGLSDVSWLREDPRHISQQNTGVRVEHRGHALGKWLKAALIDRLFDVRGAVDILTGNADSNEAMLGINRELGFEPYIATSFWEISTERARSYLDEER